MVNIRAFNFNQWPFFKEISQKSLSFEQKKIFKMHEFWFQLTKRMTILTNQNLRHRPSWVYTLHLLFQIKIDFLFILFRFYEIKAFVWTCCFRLSFFLSLLFFVVVVLIFKLFSVFILWFRVECFYFGQFFVFLFLGRLFSSGGTPTPDSKRSGQGPASGMQIDIPDSIEYLLFFVF